MVENLTFQEDADHPGCGRSKMLGHNGLHPFFATPATPFARRRTGGAPEACPRGPGAAPARPPVAPCRAADP